MDIFILIEKRKMIIKQSEIFKWKIGGMSQCKLITTDHPFNRV